MFLKEANTGNHADATVSTVSGPETEQHQGPPSGCVTQGSQLPGAPIPHLESGITPHPVPRMLRGAKDEGEASTAAGVLWEDLEGAGGEGGGRGDRDGEDM